MSKKRLNKEPIKTEIGQLPEFRYNRRRKHYGYIFGKNGEKYKNILISSKANETKVREGRSVEYDNVTLYRHPNPNKRDEKSYLINRVYLDKADSFDGRSRPWKFHLFDKRKVKKVEKGKWK